MPQEDIHESHVRHAALAQLHRWFLVYENAEVPLENQLDILDAGVELKSGLGEAVGHAAYRQRVGQLPKAWKNAHRVTAPDISTGASISLDVRVTYLNLGMRPDGAVRAAELAYKTSLRRTEGLLPCFTSIEITQLSEGVAASFEDAYAENRLRSLLHYWLALIEDPRRDPEPVREILADRFALNFSSGAVRSFDGFKAWLAGPASQLAASTHAITDFSCAAIGPGAYTVNAGLDWRGLLPDGTELVAKSRHVWTVTDRPQDRFARIATMDVEIVEPFRPLAG